MAKNKGFCLIFICTIVRLRVLISSQATRQVNNSLMFSLSFKIKNGG